MSVVPLIVKAVLEEIEQPRRILHDRNFGLGLLNDDLFFTPSSLLAPLQAGVGGYLRRACPRGYRASESGTSTVRNEANVFQVNLDVQQFRPEEVNVKIVGDHVVIEGKHEERKDEHGFISRQFARKYKLPEGVIADGIKSTISSDGILSVVAPKAIAAPENERSIPIVQTNQPAIKKGDEKAEEKMES